MTRPGPPTSGSAHDPGLYGRSFADVYDDWYANLHNLDEIVAALHSRIAPPAAIVELGSGSGRLADPLAQVGYQVIAIDSSVPMLSQDASASQCCAADMTRLPLQDACADAAVIAYNTLFNLAGVDLQQDCLHEAARTLRPGSFLAIEAFIAPPADPSEPFGITVVPHHTRPDARMAILTWQDPAESDVITGAHIELGPDGSRSRPWQLAYQSPDQIDSAAEAAGFKLEERCSDWAGTPFDPAGVRHVSWYRRA